MNEPKIDFSGFRLEHGSIEDLVKHIKDWIRWHVGGKPAPESKHMPESKPATKGDK